MLGVELFALPPSRDAWFSLLINAFIALLSDYLYVIAMLKTTPMRECAPPAIIYGRVSRADKIQW